VLSRAGYNSSREVGKYFRPHQMRFSADFLGLELDWDWVWFWVSGLGTSGDLRCDGDGDGELLPLTS
jgi:hypothetical protein